MERYLLIGLGAVLGALGRHGAGVLGVRLWGPGFPHGTLLVNVVGSFILGLFMALHLDRGLFSTHLRYFLAIGFCGSFTTFSTFGWETFRYLQEGNLRLAGLNALLNLAGCLVAVWGGIMSAKMF